MEDRKTVLIVDDDADVLASGEAVLTTAGYHVETASSGADGLALAQAVHPDIIVLDVMMESETTGFDVNHQLHQNPDLKDVPVIMLTGINAARERPYVFDTTKGWPCAAFLDKPVPPEALLAKVGELVS